PAALASAARGRPVEFAMLLAHASVLVGLEIYGSDSEPRTMPEWQSIRGDEMIPLDIVIEAFNESHRDYKAGLMDGVVVIRPVARRAPFLDQPLMVSDVDVVGVETALRKMFKAIDPSVDPSGGIVGSRRVTPEQAGDYVSVRFTRGKTVLQTLNEIASRTGLSWEVVTTRSTEQEGASLIVFAGILHRRGTTSGIQIRDRTP
ncbi:MAG TPA: hypothetical protein VFO67_01920, partial [Gemmatimonadales bacterium]|nr:hypothetical protein [Gemmatimonadales bacterium]